MEFTALDGWAPTEDQLRRLAGRASSMYDLYTILGLTRSASGDEIRAAYRSRAKRYHPDLNCGDKHSERLIKEINRAFATLGNPESRAAYDRQSEQERGVIRRRFWLSAATGAATFIVAVTSLWLTSMWTQTVSIQQSQKGEPEVLIGAENAAKKSPAEVVATRGPAASGDLDERNAPRELVIASVPGAFGEPLSSTTEETQVAPPIDRETQSAPVADPAAREHISNAPTPEPTQPSERAITMPAKIASRPEAAMAPPPEAGRKQPTPATVGAQPHPKSNPRDVIGKTAGVARVPKKPTPQLNMTGPLQGRGREPPIAARTATAQRWPSADEPFVNLGGRNR